MSRGGVVEPVRELLAPIEPAFVVLTQLGDFWFLALLAAVAFWRGVPTASSDRDRHTGAVLLGATLLATATTGLAKGWFGLARPPAAAVAPPPTVDLYAWAAGADGFGFPSGHAVGATVFYGAAASMVTVGRRRDRVAVAALLVAVVGLSRLALGVHYLVDVVAGIALGLAVLAPVLVVRRPGVLFALAGVAAAGWLALTGDADAAILLGGVGGVAVGWLAWGARATAPDARLGPGAIGAGLLAVGLPVAFATLVGGRAPSVLVAIVAGVALLVVPLGASEAKKRRESGS